MTGSLAVTPLMKIGISACVTEILQLCRMGNNNLSSLDSIVAIDIPPQ
jgi:hypothetical protein